jgi:hypothetical protein
LHATKPSQMPYDAKNGLSYNVNKQIQNSLESYQESMCHATNTELTMMICVDMASKQCDLTTLARQPVRGGSASDSQRVSKLKT